MRQVVSVVAEKESAEWKARYDAILEEERVAREEAEAKKRAEAEAKAAAEAVKAAGAGSGT